MKAKNAKIEYKSSVLQTISSFFLFMYLKAQFVKYKRSSEVVNVIIMKKMHTFAFAVG